MSNIAETVLHHILMINFQIATPERVVYKEQIDKVTLPTEMGEITVLPNHIPLVANLKTGELHVFINDDTISFSVSGGFVEVRVGNNVVVLADAAERAEEIDVKEAEEAVTRAKQIMENTHRDDVKFAESAAALERSLSRLKVARKRRYREIPRQNI